MTAQSPPLVFVLGAGASMPYGFPSGPMLRHEICTETLKPGDPRHRILIDLGFSYGLIEDCRESLARSWASSIDMFLATREDLADVGKAAIALTIARYERNEELFFAEPQGDWFRYMWRFLRRPRHADFPRDKVAFVTFNYDRSLEHALYNGLVHAYGHGLASPADLMPPIVHVYGSLGSYPMKGVSAGFSREYAEPSIGANTLASQSSINIMSEKRRESAYVTAARRLLSKAKRVAFLGFGFDEDNCELLGLCDKDYCLDRSCATMGTVLGMTPQEANRVRQWLSHPTGGSRLDYHHCDCLTFLRTKTDLLEELAR